MKPTILRIPAESLSAEAFAPFGVYVEQPDRLPDWGATGSRVSGVSESAHPTGKAVAQLWNLGELTFGEEAPYVGVVTYFNQGFQVAQLERHLHETQTWIARSGSGYLVVAPATPVRARPSPSAVRAFLIEPADMVVIGKAVWMCHFFPLGASADYVVVTARKKPEQDRDLVNFLETANTIVEIVPT